MYLELLEEEDGGGVGLEPVGEAEPAIEESYSAVVAPYRHAAAAARKAGHSARYIGWHCLTATAPGRLLLEELELAPLVHAGRRGGGSGARCRSAQVDRAPLRPAEGRKKRSGLGWTDRVGLRCGLREATTPTRLRLGSCRNAIKAWALGLTKPIGYSKFYKQTRNKILKRANDILLLWCKIIIHTLYKS
jgi:hypothetical protein